MGKRLKNMLRIGSIFASAFVGLLLFTGAGYAQSVDYRSFDADVRLFPDGSISVKETIEVIFYEEKHGIYRHIPSIYRDTYGNRLDLELDVREVRVDGDVTPSFVSKKGKEVLVKIGDPERTISGEHVYEIYYTVEDSMRFFDTFDELYWNITGSDWESPLERVTATVTYPNGVSEKEAYCYTGDFGLAGQDCAIAKSEGKIAFAAEDYLTISLSFEKGVFTEPTLLETILETLDENIFALLAFIPVIIGLVIWFLVGKDEPLGPIIAEFEPPTGISAGLAGTIIRPFRQLDKYTLSGMVVELAVKGYIKIIVDSERENPKPKEIILRKVKPADDGLDEWQKRLFAMLFNADENEVRLDEVRLGMSFGSLMQDMKSHVQGRLYKTSSFIFAIIVIVLGVAVAFVGGFFGFDYGLITGVAFLVSGALTALVGAFVFKRSETGGELYRKTAGFKLFIQTAERYRAEWESKQNIFSKYLPYALAFKDVDHWAGLFKSVPLSNETWISNAHGGVINASFVLGSLSGLQSGVASSIPSSSSSSSSGSGGGGFSGGGFGGGGGGSW